MQRVPATSDTMLASQAASNVSTLRTFEPSTYAPGHMHVIICMQTDRRFTFGLTPLQAGMRWSSAGDSTVDSRPICFSTGATLNLILLGFNSDRSMPLHWLLSCNMLPRLRLCQREARQVCARIKSQASIKEGTSRSSAWAL